ncbi:hypothetical protein D2T29_12305 [Sinirhodobacter populi]|uniref:Phosphoadenosine phosphosulphate reductase domain-containing protein n=2 Tax=Paenirhodobacter populi TaxID=2306993 RepID=A0A443KCQ7_9RHOB|nr:hypothetical protein D2T29_12305 [Sinirhodobacter populi]
MPHAAISQPLNELLKQNPPVAIGVSGGKDSQAAAIATIRHLDSLGHCGPRLLIHSDLGTVEWDDSHRVCAETARHLGLELITIRRKAGDLMDRWEARWQSSIRRYCDLSTVSLVPCWSTPKWRFCTSELKTHPIKAELRRRFRGQHIVNVTGIRRQESARRAKAEICTHNELWTDWRPIIEWTEQEVFAAIAEAGMQSHPAYRCFGMSRVSCRFCIMSSLPDLHAAARQAESAPIYRTMVDLEARSAFAFQGGRWLGDIAPDLLDPPLRQRLDAAKQIAAHRIRIETDLQPDMLYVKGWPVRMLTDTEAAILASVRQRISAIYGFDAKCLDPTSIHDRYRELIELKATKAA